MERGSKGRLAEKRIRVVSIMEAQFVTGPAKNLLEFARQTHQTPAGNTIEVSVLTYRRGRQRDEDLEFVRRARSLNVEIETVHEDGRFDGSVLPRLRTALLKRSPTILQTHNTKSHFLMAWLGLWRNHPWIAFHHGYTAEDLKMKLYNQLDRWSLRKPAALVTVCGPFADMLAGYGVPRSRIHVLHNSAIVPTPISPEDRDILRRELDLPIGKAILVAIGRLSREKGHAVFLEALRRIAEGPHRDRFLALIVGDGPERANLESAVMRLGLEGRVILAGHQVRIARYYQAADMLVLPSFSEGSPNVLLEAMAAGLPVVSCAVGGVPEIAEDGVTGVLTPPGDPVSMARGIERILANPAESARMAERGRDRVRRQFTAEAYRANLIGIYDNIAGH